MTFEMDTLYRFDVSNGSLDSLYDKNSGIFWTFYSFYILICVVAIIGNGLVLLVTYGNRRSGHLKYMHSAIKSLALADMLFGLIGGPCRIYIDYKIGKFVHSNYVFIKC